MAECECRTELDLCSECDGLRILELSRLGGITGLTITYADGSTEHRTPSAVYAGPVPPCPNPGEAAGRG